MKVFFTGIILIFIAAIFLSCDDTFNPIGPYKERMVVYAVMTTQSDTQYVRVYTTYPVTSNPLSITTDTYVPDAQVTLTHDSTTFTFRDTTLQRTDTSRYRSNIKAHVGYRIRLEGGQQYVLSVVSPSRGRATARAIALYRGGIISEPDFNGNILVRINLGSNARAYVLRLYLEYQVRVDSIWQTRRIEIPRRVDGNTGELFYPSVTSREISSTVFSVAGYEAIVTRLRQQFPGGTLRLKRTVFILTQLDDALYAYYSTANGFPDSGTLRLDEPDYSNIEGALGVFAMSSQTVVFADTTGGQAANP